MPMHRITTKWWLTYFIINKVPLLRTVAAYIWQLQVDPVTVIRTYLRCSSLQRLLYPGSCFLLWIYRLYNRHLEITDYINTLMNSFLGFFNWHVVARRFSYITEQRIKSETCVREHMGVGWGGGGEAVSEKWEVGSKWWEVGSPGQVGEGRIRTLSHHAIKRIWTPAKHPSLQTRSSIVNQCVFKSRIHNWRVS